MPYCYCTKCEGTNNYTSRTLRKHITRDWEYVQQSDNQETIEYYHAAIRATQESLELQVEEQTGQEGDSEVAPTPDLLGSDTLYDSGFQVLPWIDSKASPISIFPGPGASYTSELQPPLHPQSPSPSEASTWADVYDSEDSAGKSGDSAGAESLASQDKNQMEVDSSSDSSDSDDLMCSEDVPELLKLREELLGDYLTLKTLLR